MKSGSNPRFFCPFLRGLAVPYLACHSFHSTKKIMLPAAVITKFKIRDSSVVFYPSFELFDLCRGYHANSQENLLDNRVKGYLSPNSARRLRDMVLNWVNISKAVAARDSVHIDKILSFITLTLPADQMHSDLEIKRRALNRFLIWLQQKKGVTAFLWKAEPQENGNIHFHILVNKWIPWQEIRKYWNKVLDSLGYIQKFREKHGHGDPNSTDIHGLYKDKKGDSITYLGAYLAKYIAKRGNGEQKHARPIAGRLWGCSDNLKLIRAFVEISDSDNDFLFQGLKNSPEIDQHFGEYHRIFMGNWKKIAASRPDFLEKVENFYYSQKEILLKIE